MIRYIKGKKYSISDGIIVENGGIGYRIFVPLGDRLFMAEDGTEVKVHISMQVKENDVSLYGFSESESLEIFELLQTVSGVGAKAGQAIMSVMTGADVAAAIASGDSKSLTQAKGIGKKTADRIVLELKDKMPHIESSVSSDDLLRTEITTPMSEAIIALTGWGFSEEEAKDMVATVKGENLTAVEYIENALRNKGSRNNG